MSWAAALSLILTGAVIYVLFVYPAVLAFLASRSGRVVAKSYAHEPTVSILLPVRNGEAWIEDKLGCLLALNYPAAKTQILVASDGSDDGTEAIAMQFADRGVELARLPRNGKAAALNHLMTRATGEILFFTDVRQSIEPEALRELAACFHDPSVGVVSGELWIRSGATSGEESIGLYWQYEKWIRKNLSRLDSMLGATGCIYAMRSSLATPLPDGTLLDDVYLPLGAFFRGYRVVMEEKARAFDEPTRLDAEFRRKVRTQAGVYQLLRFYPRLVGSSNRMLLHFVSHKLGRLLLPFALIGLLAVTPALPDGVRQAVWAGQAFVYGLGLLDLWVGEEFPLKRLSSPARTFVVLMAACLCAILILIVPSRVLWPSPTGVKQGESAT